MGNVAVVPAAVPRLTGLVASEEMSHTSVKLSSGTGASKSRRTTRVPSACSSTTARPVAFGQSGKASSVAFANTVGGDGWANCQMATPRDATRATLAATATSGTHRRLRGASSNLGRRLFGDAQFFGDPVPDAGGRGEQVAGVDGW